MIESPGEWQRRRSPVWNGIPSVNGEIIKREGYGTDDKKTGKALFETAPVPVALATMAFPTIVSQIITLIYNIADTWFIGRTSNPYMIGASSLVLTVFLAATALSNLFGVGGGSLVVRLLGSRREEEARKAASLSLTMAAGAALAFSLLCLLFMNPLLRACLITFHQKALILQHFLSQQQGEKCLSSTEIKASTVICNEVCSLRSQFFQRRRDFSSHPKERSATQRLGRTTN